MTDIHKYDDIINMEHHVSQKYPQMDKMNRAAQFAPFAALTGYEDTLAETQRLTEDEKEIDENEKEILDKKMADILKNIASHPKVQIKYFIPDLRKDGGEYRTIIGSIKKLNTFEKKIIMEENLIINIEDITDVELL